MKDVFVYNTDCDIHELAINDFNRVKGRIEEMHNAKIEFIEMYKPFCRRTFFVKYKVIKESEQE